MSKDLQPTKGQERDEQLRYIEGVQKRNDRARKASGDSRVYNDVVTYCEYDGPGAPCDKLGTTVDHITPKAIAPLLGVPPEQLGSRENKQRLCRRHHNRKDKSTPQRAALLEDQMAGNISVGFGEHNALLDEYEERLREERRIRNQVAADRAKRDRVEAQLRQRAAELRAMQERQRRRFGRAS